MRTLAELQSLLRTVDVPVRATIRDSLLRLGRSHGGRGPERVQADAGAGDFLATLDKGVCTLLYHPYWEEDNTTAAERAAFAAHALPPPGAAAAGGA
jgi:hypothetical protein